VRGIPCGPGGPTGPAGPVAPVCPTGPAGQGGPCAPLVPLCIANVSCVWSTECDAIFGCVVPLAFHYLMCGCYIIVVKLTVGTLLGAIPSAIAQQAGYNLTVYVTKRSILSATPGAEHHNRK
jgi:hypothetical protein